MSGGSKCLSTNIGFAACDNESVIEYLRVMSSTYLFTNAINPPQGATALAQLRILKSEYGNRLRKKVLQNCMYARQKFTEKGFKCIGNPSPILPVFVGNELVCRVLVKMMMEEGVHVNGVEFPVVSIGQARLRVNLMPQHTFE